MSSHRVGRRGRIADAMRQVAPFLLAAVAAPLVAISSGSSRIDAALLAGFTLLVLTGGAMVLVQSGETPRWLHGPVVLGAVVALALIVHGVGGTASGATLALLVPVVWTALYGSRPEVLVVLAAMLSAVVVLTVADGTSELSTSDVRRIVVFLSVPALTAWTVSTLVQRLAASERAAQHGQSVLSSVTAATRSIQTSTDPRRTGCEAVLDVTGASTAVLVEPDGSGGLSVASLAGPFPSGLLQALSHGLVVVDAMATGRSVFVPDSWAEGSLGGSRAVAPCDRSILVQPFHQRGRVHGLVVVTWPEPRSSAPPQSANAVALLAAEVGSALERADLIETLRRRASTDPLTGLDNRRVWRDTLPGLLSPDVSVCIALLDLDFFKAYNDTRGHLAGDGLLQQLGESWRPLVRPTDLLVRWGGEEFALALPDCPLAQALEVIERLRSAVPDGQTVSAGVASWDGSESIETLMARADAALYEAKAAGRDRVVAARPGLGLPSTGGFVVAPAAR
ncbi:MAG: sensor domain-containing diguanylate cyclase [Actinomycetota bacterium]|nr:sensor domain-containing diguanylate cyclase [Actinomycetota bacterium]